MNNSFGHSFRITLYGGSHERCVGLHIDGVPAGIRIDKSAFNADLARRRPSLKGTTSRHEEDEPQLISGFAPAEASSPIADNASVEAANPATVAPAKSAAVVTDGARITIEFPNRDIRPSDYEKFRDVPRPGHADFVMRSLDGGPASGGGMFSGRMTVALVAAGTVARHCLKLKYPSVEIKSLLTAVGGSTEPDEWSRLIDEALADGDSLGGIVETVVEGLPVGLGQPFFDSVESLVSHLVFSIPGVRGVEFGDGFAAAAMRGSRHNDPLGPGGVPLRNGAGGVNGGLSNGAPLVFRTAFKPASTIARAQRTWDFAAGEMTVLSAPGRHDCCFALRTPVIVESAAAIVLADLSLQTGAVVR